MDHFSCVRVTVHQVHKKFCIDPRIITFEILRKLLAKAFEIKRRRGSDLSQPKEPLPSNGFKKLNIQLLAKLKGYASAVKDLELLLKIRNNFELIKRAGHRCAKNSLAGRRSLERHAASNNFWISAAATDTSTLDGSTSGSISLWVDDFSISYLARDECSRPTYLSLLSDWDLDAALLGFSDPYLRLKVDLQPFADGFEDWDIICPADLPEQAIMPTSAKRCSSLSFRQRLSSLGRTVEMVQKALHLTDCDNDENRLTKSPMTDSEYRNFLDSAGRLVRPLELRRSVYLGGVDPHLRKYVWRMILNVCPEYLTGQERLSYMKSKTLEYYGLRDKWQKLVQTGEITHEIQYVTNLVKKDVLRTDRTQSFYAGTDDNKNVSALYSLLTTYALNHPSVSYCQGMSDLASPLLYVMRDEAHAYICFCGLMNRMKRNFRQDGVSMMRKFDHLRQLLHSYDPEFYGHLARNDSDDLLFCYRWLLVELKREFTFEDSLRMLEVIWSSLPPDPPQGELELSEPALDDAVASCLCQYANSRMRFHACSSKSSSGHSSGHPSKEGSVSGDCVDADDGSSSGDSTEYLLLQSSLTRELGKEFGYLEAESGRSRNTSSAMGNGGNFSCSSRSLSMQSMDETLTESTTFRCSSASPVGGEKDDAFVEQSSRKRRVWPQSIMDSGITDTSAAVLEDLSGASPAGLPPPQELGDGNPFLLFVCLSILLQHRDFLLSNKMQQHFELAMHFDKMIKKHNLSRTLTQARKMFADYLKMQHQQQQLQAIESSSEETHSSF